MEKETIKLITSEEGLELRRLANVNFWCLYILVFMCFLLSSCDLSEIRKSLKDVNEHLIATAKQAPGGVK